MTTKTESYVIALATCIVCDGTVVLFAESIAETLKPEWQDAGDDPCEICPVLGCAGSHCKIDPRLSEDLADEAMLFGSRLM